MTHDELDKVLSEAIADTDDELVAEWIAALLEGEPASSERVVQTTDSS